MGDLRGRRLDGDAGVVAPTNGARPPSFGVHVPDGWTLAGRRHESVLDIYKYRPPPVDEISIAQSVLYAPMQQRVTSPLSQTIYNDSVLPRPKVMLTV